MHVVDEVERIDVNPREPIHHGLEAQHHFVVVEVLARDRAEGRRHLRAGLFVNAAVDGVEHALGEVGASAEELHFFAGFGSRYAAADRIVVAPDRTHHIVVFVLDARRIDGDLGRIFAEGLRQVLRIKHREIGFRSRPHVLERMEEAEVALRYHRTAVHAETGHLQRGPHRVAREELVVGRNTGKLHHAELHDKVVNELLRFSFRERPFSEITLDINIEKGRDTAHGHGCAVLRADGGKVAEIKPLHGFAGILRRAGNVKAVAFGHDFHLSECADLVGKFLTLTDNVVSHDAAAAVGEVLLFFRDQCVNAVERHTAVVAHDAAASVRVGQTRNDVVAPGHAHLVGVRIKNALIVGLVVLVEDLGVFVVHMEAVRARRFLSHADAAVGHERTLEGLVGLHADHLLVFLMFRVEIGGRVGCNGADNFGFTVEHAAPGAFFLLKFGQASPEFAGSVSGFGEERFVAVIRGVVLLHEVAHVDVVAPVIASEASPSVGHINLQK